MGKKPRLLDFERGAIVELRNQGLSQRAIAERINRSQTVVKNFLCDQKGYGSKNKGGRPKKMSVDDERAVISALRQNPKQSMTRLKTETDVQVHTETLRRTIKKPRFGNSEKIAEFLKAAEKAKEHAYAPYSKFRVGSAVLCTDGTIFTGCNVENCAYGDTICAERTAMVKAVSEGYRKFEAIAITSDLKDVITPCGSCRQVMIEFGSDWDVYMTRADLTYKKSKVSELLYMGFHPSNLNDSKS